MKNTLVVDLSEKVQKNKWLFKGKYKTVSEYFQESDISKWWNPEEGKGDTGQGLFAELQKEKRTIIEKWLKDKNFYDILEVGPGNGRFTEFLANTFPHVVAVEINKKFCRQLTKKFKEQQNFILMQNDIMDLEFHNDFDCVLLIDVLVHIPDIPRLFGRMKESWLKENGFAIFDITPLSWYEHYKKHGCVHRGIDKHEFESMLQDLGYQILLRTEQKDRNDVVQYIIYIAHKAGCKNDEKQGM